MWIAHQSYSLSNLDGLDSFVFEYSKVVSLPSLSVGVLSNFNLCVLLALPGLEESGYQGNVQVQRI